MYSFLIHEEILIDTPRSSGKRRDSVRLYGPEPHGGPPDAQLRCPGTSFELLPDPPPASSAV